MLAVAAQIIVCLFLAALIGFIAGWVIRGLRRERANGAGLAMANGAPAVQEQDAIVPSANAATAVRARGGTPVPESTPVRSEIPSESIAERFSTSRATTTTVYDASPNEADISDELAQLKAELANVQQALKGLRAREEETSPVAEKNEDKRARPKPAAFEESRIATPAANKPKSERLRDDLTMMPGVGPLLERALNELGVRTFRDIAAWSEEDVARIASRLGSYAPRIKRDEWVDSAKEQHLIKYGEALP
jgi:predicted flap endonuclease-1-like 5' DNA nuclease